MSRGEKADLEKYRFLAVRFFKNEELRNVLGNKTDVLQSLLVLMFDKGSNLACEHLLRKTLV